MKITISHTAEVELGEAIEYYEASQPGLSEEFTVEYEKTLARIRVTPKSGSPYNKNVRCQILHRFPYSVYYIEENREIVIVAIAHQHRKPGYWLPRIAGKQDDKVKELVPSYHVSVMSVYIQALQKAIRHNEFLTQPQTVDSDDYEESSHMFEVELSKLVELYKLEEKKGNVPIPLSKLLHAPFDELVENG